MPAAIAVEMWTHRYCPLQDWLCWSQSTGVAAPRALSAFGKVQTLAGLPADRSLLVVRGELDREGPALGIGEVLVLALQAERWGAPMSVQADDSPTERETHRVLHNLSHRSVIWRSKDSDDLVQLVIVVSSTEDGHTRDHLGKTASRLMSTS